jgi:cytoskeletal protein RodZ
MQEDNGTFHTFNVGAKIGPILEKARKERGLTLEEAEHATKIRKRYLSGLEREDYGALPDAVYARGFLKTYANYLGLDGEELARELRDRRRPRRERSSGTYGAPTASEFDQPLVNPGGLGKKERRRVSGTTIRTLIVAVLALAAVVGALYYVGRGAQSAGESPEQPPAQSEQQAANGPPQGGGQPADEAGTQDNAQGGGAGDQPAVPPQPETLTVQVSVEGDPSWLSVLADGQLSYEQIAEPGFSQTFRAQREISIKTGNAGAVGVVVNGQDLGRLGESGEVLTRDFTLKTAT